MNYAKLLFDGSREIRVAQVAYSKNPKVVNLRKKWTCSKVLIVNYNMYPDIFRNQMLKKVEHKIRTSSTRNEKKEIAH